MGGELDNNNFHQLCDQNGIKMRFSCPHTSQQNCKYERMLRTINNIVRTLLFTARLPPEYWVEALHMAEHLLNILPLTVLNYDTPYHKLYHKQPTYNHLCIFGCLCFPHIVTPHKLSPRSTQCAFLGYPSNHKGFKCLNLHTKIIISRHVVFYETIFPFGSMTSNSSPSYSLLEHISIPSSIFPPFSTISSPEVGTHHEASSSLPTSSPSSSEVDSYPDTPKTPTEDASSHPSTSAPVSSTSQSHHHVLNRAKRGISKLVQRINLHVDTQSPIPRNYL